jgi:hypothetical protein
VERRAVLEASTATGKPVRTLYPYVTNCFTNAPIILWTSAHGDAVIGEFGFGTQSSERFGVFTENTFTPLPAPPTLVTTPLSIAW